MRAEVLRAARQNQRGGARAVIGDDQADRRVLEVLRIRQGRRLEKIQVARDRRAQRVVVAQVQMRRAQYAKVPRTIEGCSRKARASSASSGFTSW